MCINSCRNCWPMLRKKCASNVPTDIATHFLFLSQAKLVRRRRMRSARRDIKGKTVARNGGEGGATSNVTEMPASHGSNGSSRLPQRTASSLFHTCQGGQDDERWTDRTKMRRHDVARDAENSLTRRYENPVNLSTANNMANRGDKGTRGGRGINEKAFIMRNCEEEKAEKTRCVRY